MVSASLIEVLTQHLNCGIVFLERLHVLSQTEALILEKSDLVELDPVVQSKERLVLQIDENEKCLADTLAQVLPLWLEVPAASRESLELLKQRALQLVNLIGEVDEENRFRLEKLKAHAVQSSRILSQDQTLRRAYNIPDATIPGFSGLSD